MGSDSTVNLAETPAPAKAGRANEKTSPIQMDMAEALGNMAAAADPHGSPAAAGPAGTSASRRPLSSAPST
jgi:hypothetical protein